MKCFYMIKKVKLGISVLVNESRFSVVKIKLLKSGQMRSSTNFIGERIFHVIITYLLIDP